METYDLIVIGAGPGGYPAARRAALLGKRTAVIERRQLGGTCLNRGCIPTKSLLHVSGQLREMKQAAAFGICCEQPSLQPDTFWRYKDSVVEELQGGISQLLKKSGVSVYGGSGCILEPGLVEVTGENGERERIQGTHILIATGSVPAIPPIPGIDQPGVITSDQVLDGNALGGKDGLPYDRLVIIGGGVIGMEFASVYGNLGSQVTVIEAADRVLPGMDREFSQSLKVLLKKRGIGLHVSARVTEIVKTEDGLLCRYEEKGIPGEVCGDGVLVAVGRRPELSGLLSPELEQSLAAERGYLSVDAQFQTSIPGIYAVGDVIGGIQLAHVAEAEGRRAVEAMFGVPDSETLSVIPSCVYTEPEIASVGMTPEEAKMAGIAVKTGKYLMSANGKSVLTRQERGFIRLVAEADGGRILGAQLMCARATDLIETLAVAITAKLTAADLAKTIAAHPTFGEGIREAARVLQET